MGFCLNNEPISLERSLKDGNWREEVCNYFKTEPLGEKTANYPDS